MRKKEILIIASIFTFLVISILSWSIYSKEQGIKERQGAKVTVKGERELSEYPTVVNVAPSRAKVDDVYTFKPLISIKEGIESVELELIESPSWLFLEERVLFGIPGSTDIGESKVTLRVYSGDLYTDYIFYVSVYEE